MIKCLLENNTPYTGKVTIKNGDQYWFKNGKQHRKNGPAFIYADGKVEYWINGERTTKKGMKLYSLLFPEEEEQEQCHARHQCMD